MKHCTVPTRTRVCAWQWARSAEILLLYFHPCTRRRSGSVFSSEQLLQTPRNSKASSGPATRTTGGNEKGRTMENMRVCTYDDKKKLRMQYVSCFIGSGAVNQDGSRLHRRLQDSTTVDHISHGTSARSTEQDGIVVCCSECGINKANFHQIQNHDHSSSTWL